MYIIYAHTYTNLYICMHVYITARMYIYVYIYIYTYTYVDTSVYNYANIHIISKCTDVCIYMYTHMYGYMYVYMYLLIHMYDGYSCINIHIYIMYVSAYQSMYVFMYLRTYVGTYTHVRMYVYIDVYVYSCVCVRMDPVSTRLCNGGILYGYLAVAQVPPARATVLKGSSCAYCDSHSQGTKSRPCLQHEHV